MRRPTKKKNIVPPDAIYGSFKVAKLINCVMERGKKDTARKIVYKVMEDLKKDGDPVVILEEALEKASPSVEVRSRRVGGANYQVPREVRPERRLSLGMRWIVAAAEGNPQNGRSQQSVRPLCLVGPIRLSSHNMRPHVV